MSSILSKLEAFKDARFIRSQSEYAANPTRVAWVRHYATCHYEQNGWDIVVESWDDSDIEECVANAINDAHAVVLVAEKIKVVAEVRAEREAFAQACRDDAGEPDTFWGSDR